MKFSKKTFKNGLRLITIPSESGLAVTALVLVETGSKYETKDKNGLSHFLEHMCFKGTKKRPKAIDISSELDSLGAQYNAFTSHEYTGYYAKVDSKHLDQALDIVSDIYLNQIFDEKEIEKEKGVICEEINMYEDIPQRKAQDLIMKLLYGDQPAGWNIAGEKDVVRSFKRKDFLKYRNEHYVSGATTVVVAGKFDKKTIVKKIEQKFKEMNSGRKNGKIDTVDIQKEPDAMVFNKRSDQTHLVLAVRSFKASDKNNYIVDVVSHILGGGMSSRLFQKVREEMGAAYYVHAANEQFTDHGFFEIAAGVDHSKIEDVVRAIAAELKKISAEAVSEKELKRVKDSIIGNIFLGLETSDSVASFFGGQEVIKREIETPEEFADKIKSVTAKDVLNVAKKLFVEKNLNLAVIGPFENKENFVKLLKL